MTEEREFPTAEPDGTGEIVTGEYSLVLAGGQQVTIADLGKSLGKVPRENLLSVVGEIFRHASADELIALITMLEIKSTPTRFKPDNERNVAVLREAARKYSFRRWLKDKRIDPKDINRGLVIEWWSVFQKLVAKMGYRIGKIDEISREANLWKATSRLAEKMTKNIALFRFLPDFLINNPAEVLRILKEIEDPDAFLEVLIGEAMEDMTTEPEFLSAMVVHDERLIAAIDNGEITGGMFKEQKTAGEIIEAVTYSTALALDNK